MTSTSYIDPMIHYEHTVWLIQGVGQQNRAL